MSQQETVSVVHKIFGRHPTHALNEAPCYLAHVEPMIYGTAQIHQDIDATDFNFTRPAVQFNLTRGDALGEIKKRATLALEFVKAKVWDVKVGVLADRDAVQIGFADQFRKPNAKGSARARASASASAKTHLNLAIAELHLRQIWIV